MKVLPKFVFLFRSLILPLPSKTLSEIQCIFNNFVWDWKKSKIKASILHKKKGQGGLALPSVMIYY